MRLVAAPLLALFGLAASAQTVTMSGSMGDKALLIINGTPRTVAAGGSFQNVKVVSVAPSEARPLPAAASTARKASRTQIHNRPRYQTEGSASAIRKAGIAPAAAAQTARPLG